jgi:hypothetical protein
MVVSSRGAGSTTNWAMAEVAKAITDKAKQKVRDMID